MVMIRSYQTSSQRYLHSDWSPWRLSKASDIVLKDLLLCLLDTIPMKEMPGSDVLAGADQFNPLIVEGPPRREEREGPRCLVF